MFCTSCGAENPSDAAFCRNCGSALSQPAAADKTVRMPAAASASAPAVASPAPGVPASPSCAAACDGVGGESRRASGGAVAELAAGRRTAVVLLALAVASCLFWSLTVSFGDGSAFNGDFRLMGIFDNYLSQFDMAMGTAFGGLSFPLLLSVLLSLASTLLVVVASVLLVVAAASPARSRGALVAAAAMPLLKTLLSCLSSAFFLAAWNGVDVLTGLRLLLVGSLWNVAYGALFLALFSAALFVRGMPAWVPAVVLLVVQVVSTVFGPGFAVSILSTTGFPAVRISVDTLVCQLGLLVAMCVSVDTCKRFRAAGAVSDTAA